jgi:hypothetical protein
MATPECSRREPVALAARLSVSSLQRLSFELHLKRYREALMSLPIIPSSAGPCPFKKVATIPRLVVWLVVQVSTVLEQFG